MYTLAEYVEAYGGSVEAPPDEWLDAAAAEGEEEHRADPNDGVMCVYPRTASGRATSQPSPRMAGAALPPTGTAC